MALKDRISTISPQLYRRIALATLISLIAITVTGGAVRLTGSGLGCSTWPNCEPDSFTPRSASDAAGMIEFGNRVVTAAVGLFALAAIYGARRRAPRRRDLQRWAWQVFGWVLVNGLVGALVVKYHLLPATVIVHFLLSMVAIWSGVVLYEKASQPDPDAPEGTGSTGATADEGAGLVAEPAHLRRLIWGANLLVVAALATIVVGTVVTGSGPHAGDEDAERLALDAGDVARVHGVTAALFLALTLWFAWQAHRVAPTATPLTDRLRWLTVVVLLQAAIGYTQYFSDLPVLLVGAHILGAALLWVAVLRVQLWCSAATRTASLDPGTGSARDWERCRVPQPQ